MKTVILINEENHGLIGVADNYKSAFAFLINNDWINDYTEICTGEDWHSYIWERVSEIFGEGWQDKMADWDIQNFNEYWRDSFFLQEIEIYRTE